MFAMPRSSRRLPLAAVVLALSLAVTACGGGNAATTSGQQAGGSGAFPVSVGHKYGTTVVNAEPKRVVTLGRTDTDPVLALGIKPVGIIDWYKERPIGNWPWAKPLWGDTQPAIVGDGDEFAFEKVAQLKPDLIIAIYSGIKKEQYDTLSKIAPVVAQPLNAPDYGASWQDMTKLTGKALGKSAQADKLVADTEAKFAAARAAHPELAGKTVAVGEPYEPGKFSVFAPTDPKMVFMAGLGMKMSDKLRAAVGSQTIADFTYENFDLVDADRLLWLTDDAGTEKQVRGEALYTKLKVVADKHDAFASYQDPPVGAALSYDSVLSIPYALDHIVPLLTATK